MAIYVKLPDGKYYKYPPLHKVKILAYTRYDVDGALVRITIPPHLKGKYVTIVDNNGNLVPYIFQNRDGRFTSTASKDNEYIWVKVNIPASDFKAITPTTLYHPQSVFIDENGYIVVSTVDTTNSKGYILVFDQNGNLIKQVDVTDGGKYHPVLVKKYLALGEYVPSGTGSIYYIYSYDVRVKLFDTTYTPSWAICKNGLIYAGDWDVEHIYIHDYSGNVVSTIPKMFWPDFQELFSFKGYFVGQDSHYFMHIIGENFEPLFIYHSPSTNGGWIDENTYTFVTCDDSPTLKDVYGGNIRIFQPSTVELYFYESNEANATSPENFFILYDDFEVLDTTKWITSGDVSIDNGWVKIGANSYIRSSNTFYFDTNKYEVGYVAISRIRVGGNKRFNFGFAESWPASGKYEIMSGYDINSDNNVELSCRISNGTDERFQDYCKLKIGDISTTVEFNCIFKASTNINLVITPFGYNYMGYPYSVDGASLTFGIQGWGTFDDYIYVDFVAIGRTLTTPLIVIHEDGKVEFTV